MRPSARSAVQYFAQVHVSAVGEASLKVPEEAIGGTVPPGLLSFNEAVFAAFMAGAARV